MQRIFALYTCSKCKNEWYTNFYYRLYHTDTRSSCPRCGRMNWPRYSNKSKAPREWDSSKARDD